MMKTCTKCGEEKPKGMFYRRAASLDGLQPICKACNNAKTSAYVSANADKLRVYKATWAKEHASAGVSWRANNRDRVNSSARARYSEDPEKAKRWRINNPEQYAAYNAKRNEKWRKEKPEQVNAFTAARRACKLRAVPKWNSELDNFVFAEAYGLAKAREKATGVKWHVDHTVPLRSKVVCGLHTGPNIAVIPARENIQKGNRHWPDMPQSEGVINGR